MRLLDHARQWSAHLACLCMLVTLGAARVQAQVPATVSPTANPISIKEADESLKGRISLVPINQQRSSVREANVAQPASSAAFDATVCPNGDTSQATEIIALASGLKCDPDLIFEFVYNAIEYEPLFGSNKGAFGTLLDQRGNDIDQVNLFAALLRAAGIASSQISYQYGYIRVTGATAPGWLRVTNDAKAIATLLASGGIPISPYVYNQDGTLNYVDVAHVWAQVQLNGTTYAFDPSFKQHAATAGQANLASILGYSRSQFLSDAGGTLTSTSFTGANRAALRADLLGYANNLVSTIRAQGSSWSVANLVGGSAIIPLTGSPLRQAALPYLSPSQPSGFPQNWGGTVPSGYRTCFTVSMPGIASTSCSNPSSQTIQLFADQTYGHRISISSVASGSNFVPTLLIDGAPPPNGSNTGTAQPSGVNWSIAIAITHPFADPGLAGSTNQSGTLNVLAGGSYLLSAAWGQVSRGMVQKHQRLLVEARATGALPASEPVLDETLATIGYSWLAQNASEQRLLGKLTATTPLTFHGLGIVGYPPPQGSSGTQGPYVDLPFNVLSFVPQSSSAGTSNSPLGIAAFTAASDALSIFESAVLEQTQGLVPGMVAASTMRLVDQNVAAGGTTFFVDSRSQVGMNTYFNTIRPAIQNTYSASTLAQIDGYVSSNGTASGTNTNNVLLLPGNGQLSVGIWTGAGYTVGTPVSGGLAFKQLISGGYRGGYSGLNIPTITVTNSTSLNTQPSPGFYNPGEVGGYQLGNPTSNEPVDAVTGAYLYSSTDLTIGSGALPYALPFGRSYSSASNRVDAGLGLGWTNSFSVSAFRTSDPYAGLGEGTATAAATSIAALYVAQDLLLNQAMDARTLTLAGLISRWLGDQLTTNAVLVRQPSIAEEFVTLPRADSASSVAYSPPAGSATMLTGTTPDSSGKPTVFTYVTKEQRRLAFNPVDATNTGSLASWSDPNGASLSFGYGYAYNGLNYLTQVSNNLGRSLALSWSGAHLASVSDGTGRSVAYGYDGRGNLASATDPLGNVTRFVYDGASRLTQIFYPANPGNAFVTNSYDGIGRVNGQANANGNSGAFYFSSTRSELVDAAGDRQVTYQTAHGRVLKDIAVLNSGFSTVFSDTLQQSGLAVTTNQYDGQDRLILTTSPEGVQTTNTYSPDFKQNLTGRTVTPKSGSSLSPLSTSYAYNATYNKPTSVTDPLGLVMSMSYDPATGNLVQLVQDAGAVPRLNATRRFSYDAHGLLISATDPLGIVTQYSYDANGNLQSTIRDAGGLNVTERRGYDAVGNALTLTDPNGNTTNSSYDAVRRPTSVTLPATSSSPALVATTTFDPDGNPLQMQQSASGAVLRTISRSYTNSGKLATSTDANGNVTCYAYDAVDRLSSVTDPVGRVTAYGYDALSRQVTVSNPAIQATPLLATQFSPDGLVAGLTDANGNALAYAYDGLDRLSTTTYPATSAVGATTETLTYDNDNNVKTRQTRRGDTISYGYDTLNRPTSKTEPSGTPSVTYAYDLASHLLAVSDNGPNLAAATPATSFVQNASYDARNRPLSVTWSPAAAQTTPAAATSVSFMHRYDASNRRIGQTANDNSWLSYPTAASSTAYTPNALNQYGQAGSVTPTYDANGSLTFDGTFTYAYDAENRLTSVTQGSTAVASYAYDGRGRRKSRTVGGTTTVYVTGAEDQELLEYDGSSGAPTATYAVNLGGGIDDVLGRATPGGARQTLIPDIQGSIIATLDSSGTLNKIGYQPFGQSPSAVIAGAGPRYTGRRLDPETATGSAQPSGLYYYRARTYSPTLGRFLQPDPIGPVGGVNLYAYVGNDPLNATDPSGLVDIALAYSNAGSAANSAGYNVYNHTYLLVTDPSGSQYVFEAGPAAKFGAGIPCFIPSACGTLTSQVVPFAQSNAAQNGTPHIVQQLLSNTASATGYVQLLQGYSDRLNNAQIPYDALGVSGNSNSAAFTAGGLVTGQQPTSIAPSPGSENVLLPPKK